jgi:hypothetical protein
LDTHAWIVAEPRSSHDIVRLRSPHSRYENLPGEMFARPPFDRRGWWYWGDAVPGGFMYAP